MPVDHRPVLRWPINYWTGKTFFLRYQDLTFYVPALWDLQGPGETTTIPRYGAVAQLGERYNGIVEVVGSIPSGSTRLPRPHRLVGLGHRPFTAATGVRIPLGTPHFFFGPNLALETLGSKRFLSIGLHTFA